MLLLGIGMLGQAIDLRQRRSHHIVDRAAEPAQFLDVVDLAYCRPRDIPRKPNLGVVMGPDVAQLSANLDGIPWKAGSEFSPRCSRPRLRRP
jgi:hypothetical protein